MEPMYSFPNAPQPQPPQAPQAAAPPQAPPMAPAPVQNAWQAPPSPLPWHQTPQPQPQQPQQPQPQQPQQTLPPPQPVQGYGPVHGVLPVPDPAGNVATPHMAYPGVWGNGVSNPNYAAPPPQPVVYPMALGTPPTAPLQSGLTDKAVDAMSIEQIVDNHDAIMKALPTLLS